MQLETTPNRPKPGTHDAAAPAQIVTTLGDAPLCVHGMDSARTPPQPQGQAQQMQGRTTAGPTMEPTTGPTQAAGDGHSSHHHTAQQL